MIIFTDAFVPYEFDNKFECFKHLEYRCMNIKNSLRLVEKDNEHLRVRCPISGDYLDVVGTPEELEWIDTQLSVKNWYRR